MELLDCDAALDVDGAILLSGARLPVFDNWIMKLLDDDTALDAEGLCETLLEDWTMELLGADAALDPEGPIPLSGARLALFEE